MAKYLGNLMMSYDYYTFGMQMPGRVFNSGSYRYGIQGQEMDNEISGIGYHYTAKYWEYDPRVVRRWNIDPEFRKIPGWSSYAILGDNPIIYVDKQGDLWDIVLDVGFILYDVGEIAYDYFVNDEVDPISVAALSADVTAAAIPGVTGAGIATRIGAKTAQTVTKASNIIRRTVKFSGYGGDIAVRSDRVTTVLGRFEGAIDGLKKSGEFKTDGLRFMDVPEEIAEKAGESFFTQHNVPFLNNAIDKGQIIRFVSDPTSAKALYKNGKDGALTTFGKEVEFLKNKGYDIKKGVTEIDLSIKP